METTCSEWMRRYSQRAKPASRLFCFPYAGSSATVFRRWARSFPPEVEVCSIEYPGRGSRVGEPLLTEVGALAAGAGEALQPFLDVPFATLGYSLGALVAFEWLSGLAAKGGPTPTCLFVCARRAPHLPLHLPPLHALPDRELVTKVQARYGGIPPEILNEPGLLALLLPVLRADLRAYEEYEFRDREPLVCPIHAFTGTRDRAVSREDVEAWGRHTTRGLTLEMVEAGHVFIGRRELEESVVRRIKSAESP